MNRRALLPWITHIKGRKEPICHYSHEANRNWSGLEVNRDTPSINRDTPSPTERIRDLLRRDRKTDDPDLKSYVKALAARRTHRRNDAQPQSPETGHIHSPFRSSPRSSKTNELFKPIYRLESPKNPKNRPERDPKAVHSRRVPVPGLESRSLSACAPEFVPGAETHLLSPPAPSDSTSQPAHATKSHPSAPPEVSFRHEPLIIPAFSPPITELDQSSRRQQPIVTELPSPTARPTQASGSPSPAVSETLSHVFPQTLRSFHYSQPYLQSKPRLISKKHNWFYRTVAHPAGIVKAKTIKPTGVPVSSAGGYETLCSYNWTNAFHPEILVPGAAPQWTHRACPVKLKADRGVSYSNINSARSQHRPFEPMFSALTTLHPEMKLDDIDVILTRNTIRSLLSFVKTGMKNSVAMQMHLINNTLIIAVEEKKNQRYNDPLKNPTWGHAFEDAFTAYTADLRKSISHHRVIKYKLGSVTVAVCHEADASYPQLPQGPRYSAYQKKNLSHRINPSAGLKPRYKRLDADVLTKVRVAGAGTFPSEMAELKTSCSRKSSASHMDQLWFGRTSYIITGRHTEGNFKRCVVVNAESKFSIWEERHQKALQKLGSLFMTLRERVRSLGGQGIGIIDKSRSKSILEIWTAQQKLEPLSVEFIERHWSQGESRQEKKGEQQPQTEISVESGR